MQAQNRLNYSFEYILIDNKTHWFCAPKIEFGIAHTQFINGNKMVFSQIEMGLLITISAMKMAFELTQAPELKDCFLSLKFEIEQRRGIGVVSN